MKANPSRSDGSGKGARARTRAFGCVIAQPKWLLVLASVATVAAMAVSLVAHGGSLARAAEEASLSDRLSAARAADEILETVSAKSASLDVVSLLQNPELPTGCESVALTDVLLYYGFELEKTTIADEWLPVSSTDFVTAFLGDPHDAASHACLAPCIVATANGYLSAQGSSLVASDVTGSAFAEVLDSVAEGSPVIVWATVDLKDPGDEPYLTQWENDRLYGLYANNHCMVVCGYNSEASTVTVCDPLEGIVDYDMGLLAERFAELGSQAVVIE